MDPVVVDACPRRSLKATGIDLPAIPAKHHRIEEVVVAYFLVDDGIDQDSLAAYVMNSVVLDDVAIAIQVNPGSIVSDVVNVLNQIVYDLVVSAFESNAGSRAI